MCHIVDEVGLHLIEFLLPEGKDYRVDEDYQQHECECESGCGCDCGDVSLIISAGELPRCKRCGGIIKPRVVLYGEMLDETVIEKAIRAIESADMLIVGGTSLAVSPANTFVRCFMGKYAVMINQTSTDYDRRAQLIIRDKIGTVLSAVMKELERK